MSRYRKSIAALLTAVATWGATAAADGSFDAIEWSGLLGALATVVAVWGVPNDTPTGEPRDPAVSERG